VSYGRQLVDIHLALREELGRLRETPLAGSRDLRIHCLAFCAALARHHTGEDGGAFVVLAERHPELRPVIEELVRDHETVADVLRHLAELLVNPDAADVHMELDGLAAVLESHFGYEERKLIAALDTLDPTADGDLLGAPRSR
jgi:Hemerythrin HHE cation binding domain